MFRASTQTTSPAPAGKTGIQLPGWAGSFGFQIIAALIVGLGLGLLAKYTGSTKANPNALGTTLQTIGSSYVSLLQTAVVPLIFTAVVSSISSASSYNTPHNGDPFHGDADNTADGTADGPSAAAVPGVDRDLVTTRA